MKRRSTGRDYLIFAALVACAVSAGLTMRDSLAAPTPELETLAISKRLKPIADDEWKLIAGARTEEKYEVMKGDNLFTISKRLFGDGKYWPKVWALNNQSITNPHRIEPGQLVAFMPGTGTSLPAVSIGGGTVVATATDATDSGRAPVASKLAKKKRSTQWKDLPQQEWETVKIDLPPDVDKDGFDRRNKISFNIRTGIDLPIISASEELPILGRITGARTAATFVTLGDTVYLESDGDLQIGEVYAISDAPARLKSSKSDRTGYAYAILGRLKIIGVRDGVFVGTIIGGKDIASRGSILIPSPSRVQHIDAIAGPAPLEGIVMSDRSQNSFAVAQHKQVFIDRGTEDGIRPGMVFRAYQHQDPGTRKDVTESDFIVDADILVLQVSERFCTGIIIRSINEISLDSPVVLLTDVTDLSRSRGLREKDADTKVLDDELDRLDSLDGDGLGREERKELKQLEKWKEPKDESDEASGPEDEPPPAPLPEPEAPMPTETEQAPAMPVEAEPVEAAPVETSPEPMPTATMETVPAVEPGTDATEVEPVVPEPLPEQ